MTEIQIEEVCEAVKDFMATTQTEAPTSTPLRHHAAAAGSGD
jgi:hypothetical protein